MQDNTAKWKTYANAQVLSAVGGVANLNTDLQKNIGDELDVVLNDLLGASALLAGFQVQTTTGLAVEVTTGTAFVSGQRVRHTIIATVTGLPAVTTGIKIYVEAGATFSLANRGWPASCGFSTSALGVDQLLLATVETDGSGVTSIVDDRVFMSQLLFGPTAPQKAAFVGTGPTAPSGENPYVVDSDTRLAAFVNLLADVATFVATNVAKTITAIHTFDPTVAGPPFLLADDAKNQKVIGLEADRLDGEEGVAFHAAANLTGTIPDNLHSANMATRGANTFTAPLTLAPTTPTAPLILSANAQGQIIPGLNADYVDGEHAALLHDATLLTGTIPDALLSSNIVRRIVTNVFTAQQNISPLIVTPPVVLGGNALNQKVVGWNADRLDDEEGTAYHNAALLTGALADARLSTNVPRRDAPGTFIAKPNFAAGAEVGTGNDVWHEGNDSRLTVRIYHTVNQLIANNGAFQTINFNTIRYQRGQMYTSGSSLFLQRDGIHQISVNLQFTTNATGTFRAFRVLLNGTTQISPAQNVAVSGSGFCVLNGSMPGNFVTGDYLQVQVAHDATVDLNILAVLHTSPEFAVQWQGPST